MMTLSPLRRRLAHWLPWGIAWLALGLAGVVWLGNAELTRQREAFEADARIVHRLLSQRAVEHEAVLATLALLDASADTRPEQRLPAIYPRILTVARNEAGQAWPVADQAKAEADSRRLKRAVAMDGEFARGRFWLVLAATPTSYALQIDLGAMVPDEEWPVAAGRPVDVRLEHAGQSYTIQAGIRAAGGWRFSFRKTLAAASQPFEVQAERRVGWQELPWGPMLLWLVAVSSGLAILAAFRRQRAERQRAEERLRLGQVARLNALGELAAGMAHELNQPLTAVLANVRAAARLLDDEPPELDTARQAMARAAEQARRAAEVLSRLRRAVERPQLGERGRSVELRGMVDAVLRLIEPECRQRQVQPRVLGEAAVRVTADPIALEQIVHNLLMNALQALEQVPATGRALTILLAQDSGQGKLTVRDSGPGIPPEMLPRIFEPFFTTRADGLGLGLSLCETLAASMGGSLSARPASPHGAEFCLRLPLSSLEANAP